MIAYSSSEKEIVKRESKDSNVIRVGDLVTIDNSEPMKIYVVNEIADGKASILSLALSSLCDDVYLKERIVDKKDLVYIKDFFVNSNGILYNVSECIRKNIPLDIEIIK